MPWSPHAGDWRDAGIFRDGLEFNHPLMCRNVSPHPGTLPRTMGAARSLQSQRRRLVARNPDRDGDVALRIYEASGRPAPAVTIKLTAPIESAREANLLEDPGSPLSTSGNAASRSIWVRLKSRRSCCGCVVEVAHLPRTASSRRREIRGRTPRSIKETNAMPAIR